MTTPTHGGARKGAGRPTVPPSDRTVTVAVSMPRWLRDRLRAEAVDTGTSVSALVTDAMTRDRQPPDGP